jgi:hypothetical protein
MQAGILGLNRLIELQQYRQSFRKGQSAKVKESGGENLK